MKQIGSMITKATRIAPLFPGMIAVVLFLAGCTPKETSTHAHAETYTCPMHPDVQQPGPGKCPVCGMDLVKKSAEKSQGAEAIMLNDSQVRLANITTQKVARREMGQTVIIHARLTVDEERTGLISSRTAGRIEKLYVRETGRLLRAGEPFMEIYSESLLTLQREFLLATERYDQSENKEAMSDRFVQSARKKLLLYGLTDRQITQLSQTRQLQERVTFLAPSGGIITSIMVSEGQYVDEGAPLYRTEDISQLWVEAELYPGETGIVAPGDRVEVRISGQEDVATSALVTFVSPEYRENSQVTILRATLGNSRGQWKPGMAAQVLVTRDRRQAIAIPTDAVIREEHGSHVFVMTDRNTFARRSVSTGLDNVDLVEITSGLQEGEMIAVTGAYLLHSELILKGGTPHSH